MSDFKSITGTVRCRKLSMNVFLQDFFHIQIMEGNLTKTLEKYLPYVGKKHKRAYIYPCTLIGKQMHYMLLWYFIQLCSTCI